jgi:hypothetical protein
MTPHDVDGILPDAHSAVPAVRPEVDVSMKLDWMVALAALAVIVAACGGGGGSSVAPGTGGTSSGSLPTSTLAPSTSAPLSTQSVTLSIVIPKSATTSTNVRKVKYIPSNTASLTLALVSVNGTAQSGSAQGPFNLTAPTPTNPNPNCTAGSSGTSCSFTIAAPIGTDIFTANTFSNSNGTGALGSGAIEISVTANARNTASLTLDGPVASVSLFSATNGYLSNGNPLTQSPLEGEGSLVRAPGHANLTSEQAAAISAALTRRKTAHATGSSVRAPAQLAPTPTPAPTTQTSSRIFVIALDSAGNQIINPTTFDIPITLTLALNGTPPNVVSLAVQYAGLSAADSGSQSTANDGGTITIYSPIDQITMAITANAASQQPFTPSISASYTPQNGSPQATSPLSFSVSATPPEPYYALSATHTGSLVTNMPGDVYATVSNTGGATSSGTIEVSGYVYYANINGFGSTSTTFWNCTVTYASSYFSSYDCTSNAGQVLLAGQSSAIDINVTPTSSTDVSNYPSLYVGGNQYAYAYDDIPVSAVATPTPTPGPVFTISAIAEPSAAPVIYTNDQTGYLVAVTNAGQLSTTGALTLTNTLPSGFMYQGYSGTGWTCSPATGPSTGPITCIYSSTLAQNTMTPYLTLTESAGNATAFTSVSNLFTASGGGAPSDTATVNTSVLPALQFTGASFSPSSATFTPASLGTNALIDFGLLAPSTNGYVTLRSYYTASGHSMPTIASVSDACYPAGVTASPNPIPMGTPLPLATTAPYNVELHMNYSGGAVGPCTITATDGYGSTAAVTIQAEQTNINISAKGRTK